MQGISIKLDKIKGQEYIINMAQCNHIEIHIEIGLYNMRYLDDKNLTFNGITYQKNTTPLSL